MASFELRGSGPQGTLVLSGECTIAQAGDMKNAFMKALETYEELDLDMSGIKQADLTLLQLVMATHAELAKKGKSLSATAGTPPIVASLAEEAGLTLGSYEQCFWKKG